MIKKSVLIVGSFRHPKNRQHSTTAAEQLAALFEKNEIPVIKTSRQYKRVIKIADTIKTIVQKRSAFSIAILPLYGTPLSFIWIETAAMLLKLFNKKIILIVHGGSIPAQMQQGKTKFLKALQRVDLVVAPSAYFKDFLSAYQVPSVVIENAIDLSAYQYQPKKKLRPHILWMRSFDEIYNPAMAVRVAKILSDKFPGFKMVMAGNDSGQLDEIKQMVIQYKLQEKISFPGYINIDDKNKLATEYDIYISTNLIDNAPVSIVEFMALGLPVISINCGGVPYLIEEGVNGMLVNTNDDIAMTEKIEMLINDEILSMAISSNARLSVQQYDSKPVLKKWQDVLTTLY